jgi:ATP/maltotriose-dependent transcriptional regulator MalT
MREFKRSLATLEEVRRSSRSDRFILMNVGAILARVYLALGSPDRALRALEEHLGTETTPGMEAEFQAWWGLVLACLGRFDEATERASEALAATHRTEVAGLVPWISTVSDFQRGVGSTDKAVESFRESSKSGNVDAFVTSYRACRQLLPAVAADKRTHRELRMILSRANDQDFGGALGFHIPTAESSRTRLTRRERDVLDLLVQGATNKEIARALFISEATAKAHLRHIYAKMGVRSRAEAIIRTRDDESSGEC